MSFYLIGLNHNTAPLEIRESLSISQRKLPVYLEELCSHVQCGVILSTCNRTEFYLWDDNPGNITKGFDNFLHARSGLNMESISNYLYCKHDADVALHLFRVASGLESMILGEYEVLGQVKNAYYAAESAGSLGLALKKLFEAAIKTGRRVREETAISQNSLSASSMAVDIALSKSDEPADLKALVIGTGEAGKLVAQVAKAKGVGSIIMASRYCYDARDMADKLDVELVDFACVEKVLQGVDIIITCAHAPHYLLNAEQIRHVLSNNPGKKLVIVDIGVPRNVDPAIHGFEGVLLYNIDDIGRACDSNLSKRQTETNAAQAIIDQEIVRFREFSHTLNVRPIIRSLAQRAENIRASHLETTLRNLNTELSPKERYQIDAMTKAIVNRILQDPIGYLKQNPQNSLYVNAAVELFKLSERK